MKIKIITLRFTNKYYDKIRKLKDREIKKDDDVSSWEDFILKVCGIKREGFKKK